MSFKLSRIAAKFNHGQWNIHKFGYDENGKFVKSIDKYRDYFFYDYNHIQDLDDSRAFDMGDDTIFKTLYGEMVQKVYYNSIKAKNKLDKENKLKFFNLM